MFRTVAGERNGSRAEGECVLCGKGYAQGNAVIELSDEGLAEGQVCPVCAHLGPVAAAGRARRHATRLRAQAAMLDYLAEGVRGITEWAGIEELVRVELRVAGADWPLAGSDIEGLVAESVSNRLRQVAAELVLEGSSHG
jgi:hypothetical protein